MVIVWLCGFGMEVSELVGASRKLVGLVNSIEVPVYKSNMSLKLALQLLKIYLHLYTVSLSMVGGGGLSMTPGMMLPRALRANSAWFVSVSFVYWCRLISRLYIIDLRMLVF